MFKDMPWKALKSFIRVHNFHCKVVIVSLFAHLFDGKVHLLCLTDTNNSYPWVYLYICFVQWFGLLKSLLEVARWISGFKVKSYV